MISLFKKPVPSVPDMNYINFREQYVNNLNEILLLTDALYVKNNHLFVQLVRQCSLAEDKELYYRSSVNAIKDYLTQHRYGSFETMGRTQSPVFFTKPITELVLHHTEFPGTTLFLDSGTDPRAYEPVRLIYHPFTTLHFRYFDGKYNPRDNVDDPYVFYLINIPELVLQWLSYRKYSQILGNRISINDYVSKYIIMSLMKQYASISLFNQYMAYHLDLPVDPDPTDNRFGFNQFNKRLLDRGIIRNHITNNKYGIDKLLSLSPTLSDQVDFYLTHTTTQTNNGRPFMDLSRLTVLIRLFSLLPVEEERGLKSKLYNYTRRMLKGKEYHIYLGDKHYPYFESRIMELQDLIA